MRWLFTEMRDSEEIKEAKKWLSPPWWRQPGPGNHRKTLFSHRPERGTRGGKTAIVGLGTGLATVRDRVQSRRKQKINSPVSLPSHTPMPCQWPPLATAVHRTQLPGVTEREWRISVCQESDDNRKYAAVLTLRASVSSSVKRDNIYLMVLFWG